MMTSRKIYGLLAIVSLGLACTKNSPQPTVPQLPTLTGGTSTAASQVITIDAGVAQGNVMRFEQSNVHSTTIKTAKRKIEAVDTIIEPQNH
jgi:hypothetical protein